MNVGEKLECCFKNIEGRLPFKPEVALVLGSGLGNFVDEVLVKSVIPYASIKYFPLSTAPGHKGAFVFALIEGVPTVIMQGRIHYYEGYAITDVVLPIRMMKLMGAEVLFLTNAAGGVNKQFQAGDFMLITDHISSFVPSPLIGKNLSCLGTRFPDMSNIYNEQLQVYIKETAVSLQLPLKEGVYLQFTGPAYETPQEIRLAEIFGADAVGMSTAVEAVAAHHAGMRVCGVSFISNMAAGISTVPLNEQEVLDAGKKAASSFKQLITGSIMRIGRKSDAS